MTNLDAILEAQENIAHHRSLHLTPSNGGNMSSPWMWFDNDPGRSVEEKVAQAVEHYHAKFGRSPNTCYVNHKSISGDFTCGKVKVKPASNILPDHYWMGVKA